MRSSWAKQLLVAGSLTAVPLMIMLVKVTRGAILPSLPGQQRIWNIQFLMVAVAGIVGMAIPFLKRNLVGKRWLWAAVAWNLGWAAMALYAMYSLWGEKV